MPRYYAAPGSPFTDDDAAEIGPELERLAQRGASSPDEIVAYAKATETPLRKHLHLDRPMEDVADAWYRNRARKVAGSIMVRVKVGDGYREMRAFHSVAVQVAEGGRETRGVRYVTVAQVRNDDDLSAQVIERAQRELIAWRERYEMYSDYFGPVFAAIDQQAAA